MLNQKIQAHRQEHASLQNYADDNSFTTISTVKVTEHRRLLQNTADHRTLIRALTLTLTP